MTLDQIEAVIRSQARLTATRILLDETMTDVLVSEPWRLTRAVYGLAVPSVWPPVHNPTATEVLADCADKIACQIAWAKAGEWSYYSQPVLVTLRQAENALLRIILDP